MDWARLHAALNDLPAALLLVAVLFDGLGAILRRESLKAAGFWTLVTGVVGTLLAIGAGLMAEDAVEHTGRAHDLMERHETLAFVVLGIFAVLLLWRIIRRTMARTETTMYLTVGVVGIAILVFAAKIGGSLVFDHALGVRTERLQAIQQERQTAGPAEHEHEQGEEHDSAGAAAQPAR